MSDIGYLKILGNPGMGAKPRNEWDNQISVTIWIQEKIEMDFA